MLTLDAAGNTVVDRNGNRELSYDQVGRLSQVTMQGVIRGTYSYNYRNLRTRKIRTSVDPVTGMASTATFVFHYDLEGRLIAETRPNGRVIRLYAWVDHEPIVQVQNRPAQNTEELSYLHVDALLSPRLATNPSQTVVWRNEFEAFGPGQPDTDPDDDLVNHFVRLRMAGQYFDGESGLFYNWNRYYDPRNGRYVTSDPIGLESSLNTYAYVDNNPLTYTDPTGLGKVGFCIKTVKKIWKAVSKERAEKELEKGGNVLVEGAGASKKARQLARQQFGNKTVRHDAHDPNKLPHYQHKSGGKGHVFYNSVNKFTAVGAFGSNWLTETVDVFNPVSDVKDVMDLFGEDCVDDKACQ